MILRSVCTVFLFLIAAYSHGYVSINEHQLIYRGQITEKNNQQAFTLFADARNKPTELVISSGGGNVDLGMDLGEFVLAHQLDVRVQSLCFSSCANYVFTAGNTKWLEQDAILGWHGDAASAYWRDGDIDAMVADLSGEQRELEWQRLRAYYDNVTAKSVAREQAFYAKLKIDKSLMTLGLTKQLIKVARKMRARGWTVTPELMEKLGIKNIRSTQGIWQPKSNDAFPLLILGE